MVYLNADITVSWNAWLDLVFCITYAKNFHQRSSIHIFHLVRKCAIGLFQVSSRGNYHKFSPSQNPTHQTHDSHTSEAWFPYITSVVPSYADPYNPNKWGHAVVMSTASQQLIAPYTNSRSKPQAGPITIINLIWCLKTCTRFVDGPTTKIWYCLAVLVLQSWCMAIKQSQLTTQLKPWKRNSSLRSEVFNAKIWKPMSGKRSILSAKAMLQFSSKN